MSRVHKLAAAGAAIVALGVSSIALGLPWDLDMADGQAKKAFSHDMPGLPQGVVAQDNVLSPRGFARNGARGLASSADIVAPASSDASVASGAEMYRIFCTPCHGADGINLGPVAAPGRLPGVVALAGPTGVAKLRSDAWLYLTIRNGGAVMPSYGHAMTEAELWATVHFVRTLKNSAYVPPEPEGEEAAQ